ncbi:MAG: CvpA family protein [Acetatifactor sp.]|nr:CvpA family protein [Acetatifactor sp.]
MIFDGNSINLLLIGLIVLVVITVRNGYKKGMVRAIVSLVSMVVLSVVVLLLAHGISSYNHGNIFHVILTVVLLTVLGVVHHLLSVAFFTAKIVVRLPVVKFLDKLLGIVFGFLEAVLILWTVYTFVMMMDLGVIKDMIIAWTDRNPVLTWFYEHNYLAYGIDRLLSEFSFIPLAEILSIGK